MIIHVTPKNLLQVARMALEQALVSSFWPRIWANTIDAVAQFGQGLYGQDIGYSTLYAMRSAHDLRTTAPVPSLEAPTPR